MFVCFYLFVYSFVYLFIYLLIYLFIYSFIHCKNMHSMSNIKLVKTHITLVILVNIFTKIFKKESWHDIK
jgi:hypothetical protein